MIQQQEKRNFAKYDSHTEKIISLVKDSSDADKKILIAVIASILKRGSGGTD